MIIFKYYNKEFLVEHKLNDAGALILMDTIFAWIFADKHPEYKLIDNEIYFYLSQQYLTRLLDSVMNFVTVNRKFDLFRKSGLIKKQCTEKKTRKVFYCFDWNLVEKCLATESELKEMNFKNNWLEIIQNYKKCQISLYNYKGEEKPMLFDPNDRKGYSIEAETLVRKIIKQNRDIFKTKLPEDYKIPKISVTFVKACRYIQDIYNGNFTNPHLYSLSLKFKNNSQFDISGYKDILCGVKGDWIKVRNLLLKAVGNFRLMFEGNRMPISKEYLQRSLTDWLYDWADGDSQSQFILSLKEPEFIRKHFSEKKADKIYKGLNESAMEGGNQLVEIAPAGFSAGTFWDNIRKMAEFCREVFRLDENCKYWVTNSGQIIIKFAEYCKKKNVSVNCSTVDIEKSVKKNMPWVWFISDAIKRYGLNSDLIECGNVEDLIRVYRQISFRKVVHNSMQDLEF